MVRGDLWSDGSLVEWFDLHLGEAQRVSACPVPPHDAGCRPEVALHGRPVQVAVWTTFEPPASTDQRRARVMPLVAVVFSAEIAADVILQRITLSRKTHRQRC